MKKCIAFLLCLFLMLGCIPFWGITAFAQTDTEYTIFLADPSVFGEAGTNVTATATNAGLSSNQKVYSAVDEEGNYYYTFTQKYVSSASQYGGVSYAKSGHNNNETGFEWIGNSNTLNALSGFVKISAEVRITQTGYANPNGMDIYIGGACSDTSDNVFMGGVTWAQLNKHSAYGTWTEFSGIPTSLACFHTGYIGFKAELRSKSNATVVSDFRNIKFTIKESQRKDIDSALKEKGSAFTFNKLISNYHEVEFVEDNDSEPEVDYTIFGIDPASSSVEVGKSVKATLSNGSPYSPKYDTVKTTDGTDTFYRTNITVTGSGGDGYNTVFNSYLTNIKPGYGWLEDVTVLKTIRAYMTVNLEYRVNAVSGTVPSNGMMYINAAHAYSGRATSLFALNMANATDWKTYSVTLNGENFVTWYSGFVGLSVYSSGGKFDGSYNIDIKNFDITLNSKDKIAINGALKAAGSLWTFEDIVQTDSDYNDHKSIWYASPERLGANAGDDVTGSVSTLYNPADFKTYVANEKGVDFYRTEMNVSGKGGDGSNAVFKTGFDSNSKGFGWLANKNILNAIAPYMYITFDYRFTGSNLPSDAYIYFGAASKYGKISKFGNLKGEATEWTKYELKVIGDSFSRAWNEGYFTFNIYSDSGSLTGTQTFDIRNLRIEFRYHDRVPVNTVLSKVSSISSITNFTKGIIRDRDESGYYNYFKTFVEWLPNVEFDANDDDIFNLIDIVRMKKITSGKIWVPKVIKQRLDIDGDNIINSTELASAKKELVTLIESPYVHDELKVSLETEHPGVAQMDAYYDLVVTDKSGNTVSQNNVTVTTNNNAVAVNGYALTVPYSVRSGDEKLTVTVTSKNDSSVYGRYDFEFVKFTTEPTLTDDFNYINTEIWSEMYQGGKYEIENGKLKFTSQVGQTVGLTSKNTFEQAYGSFSASIRMPEKALVNGAFWLYSNSGKMYRRNPFNPSQSGGEIDIVEYFPTWTNGAKWSATVHWYGSSGTHRFSGDDSLNAGVDLGNDYHIYSAVWMKNAVYNYLDGKLYRVYDGEGVSDHSDGMQIILSLHGCDSDSDWGGKFNAADFPDTMHVDWIKVYGLNE